MSQHDQDHEHDHHDVGSPELRTEALESLLVEKGLVAAPAIDKIIERYENDVGPMNGARVVARAWVDEAFRSRLLSAGHDAVAELEMVGGGQMDRLEVKENTEKVHNVICCTLCSCYPWAVLGLPPAWYKDPAYRSRIVREPRAVLAEMGLELSLEKKVQVWDSSAEVRYMVLPERPENTGALSEDQLASIVTRESMIGTAVLAVPEA